MANFSSIIVASVNLFTKGELDKNGQQPVILNVVAGKYPNRNVLSGTIAKSIGIEVGKSYLLSIKEGEPSEQYGRQFVYQKLKELTAMEIVQSVTQMEAAMVFDAAEKQNTNAKVTTKTLQEQLEA